MAQPSQIFVLIMHVTKVLNKITDQSQSGIVDD